MSVQVSLKKIRRNIMRISTKTYLRLVTGLVVAGIFISEGSVKELSEAQNVRVMHKHVKGSIMETSQLSSQSTLSTNRTGEGHHNDTESAISSPKVARTLQKLLQESLPERIFGFASGDNNISYSQHLHSSSSLLSDTSLNKSVAAAEAFEKRHDTPMQHRKVTNSSKSHGPQVLLSLATLKTYQNETESSANSGRREVNSHRSFRGVLPTKENKHLFKTDNVTHLSFMLYRLIKTHNIKSVLDVPCKQSILWIGDLLRVLEFEVPKFHYKCLAPDNRNLAEGVVRFQHLSSATVLKKEHPWASRLPKADLALCWYGMGFLPPHESWSLLKALRAAKVKFALLPNYPEVRHNPGSGSALGRINVRRSPYRFNEPLRVVNNVSAQASHPKQLLFYDLEGIRKDVL